MTIGGRGDGGDCRSAWCVFSERAHLLCPSFDLVRLLRRRRRLSLESGEPRLHRSHLRVELFGPLLNVQHGRVGLGTPQSGLLYQLRVCDLEG